MEVAKIKRTLGIVVLVICLSIEIIYLYEKHKYENKVMQTLYKEGVNENEIYQIKTGFNKFGYWSGVIFSDEKDVIYIYEKNEKNKEIFQTGYDSLKSESKLKHYVGE
ncbi:hypothetical protein [Falsibacillus pallidus]|uniref:DUF3139 domain-containing protein n=1 Tax=Falsibacillus pallidus TaxID=493781 RepID=A0A370GXM6_9BACI|nr:hypothetical protein [Falsibacillus pallidus]RDI48010.1 hypothetical protein DFR59_101679 [Falsibacillus pallidus]